MYKNKHPHTAEYEDVSVTQNTDYRYYQTFAKSLPTTYYFSIRFY